MIVCPTCGAHNDPGNHFCDQCGTRLENAQTTAASSTETATEQPSVPTPSAPSPTCPNCSAAVMLGQAFCDECGYPLNQVYSEYTASDAPTMVAPPDLQPSAPVALPVEMDAIPAAEPILSDQPAVSATPPAETEAPASDPLPISEPEPAAGEEAPEAVASEPVVAAAPVLPVESPVESQPEPVESQPELPVESQLEPVEPEPAVHTTTVVAPEPTAPAATRGPSDEERRRLEDLIMVHRDTVTQYEQMLQRYPAGAAPAFLTAGLDEARNALAQAKADLAALPTGPDPAEVTRLESLITAHRDTVTQYEQMLQRYPAGAAPAFLTAGLDEARNALAQAETELSTFLGSATTSPTAESMAGPTASAPSLDHSQAVADETVAAPSLPETAAVPAAGIPPITLPPAAPPQVVGPRILIVEGNHELFLPTDKSEIIVGREDPVSQIYPEIDLTAFGGEMGGVSRQHARISHTNGQWAITDLDSTNYTRVDGNRIAPNTPTPIHDGAQLQFGRIAAVFYIT